LIGKGNNLTLQTTQKMENSMKKTLILTQALFALLISAQVMAEDVTPTVDLDKRGDRIEERLDNRGDRREDRTTIRGRHRIRVRGFGRYT
jgi:hypothetical protein